MLLDTNVVLRIADSARPLPPRLADAVYRSSPVMSSLARAEIGIKLSVGKLALSTEEAYFWRRTRDLLQAEELPFTAEHAGMLHRLPLHHRDPFDRMIAAQCLVEELTLASTDAIFAEYGVRLLPSE